MASFYPEFLLGALFILTIAHLVTLKVCSLKLDHRTAPLFVSGWVLVGLAITYPSFSHLVVEGFEKFKAAPYLLGLALLKGVLLYYLFIFSQDLMKVSLSSRHYVTPLSVGLIAVVNSFLGEDLTGAQWARALGLCALSAAFFAYGHLADIGKSGRLAYLRLVLLSVVLAALDQVVTKDVNWYSLLLVSNIVMFVMGIALNRKQIEILKAAAFHKSAILAGVVYAATELLKFYQQVSINPLSVVIITQAMTKPVILVLSAWVWKERTVKEQLVWGLLALLVIIVPFF